MMPSLGQPLDELGCVVDEVVPVHARLYFSVHEVGHPAIDSQPGGINAEIVGPSKKEHEVG